MLVGAGEGIASPKAERSMLSSEFGNWEPFGRARWRGSDMLWMCGCLVDCELLGREVFGRDLVCL